MPAVVLNNPADIQHVLLENVSNYRKDDLLLRVLSPGLSNGILTVDGEQWRRQRHAVAPIFARKTIHGFAPDMAAAADALAARWSQLGDATVVDVADEMARLTLDVLSRTVFSGGIERETGEFREAMRAFFDTIGRIDPLDALGFPDFLPRPTRWRVRKPLRFFSSAVDAIIAGRCRLIAEDPDAAPRDLLTLLIEARDQGSTLSDAELRANLITLIAAGHETTANTLTWCLYLLSQSETWKEQVIAEAHTPPHKAAEDPCKHLPVTRAVIDETLRLYPPIAAISRVARDYDELSAGQIRPGTMVIVAPYVLHRHRRLWKQPETFEPARFLDGSAEPAHRFAYLPFGAGPRICLGAAFALQEATLALATLMRNFELRPVPGRQVEPMLRITLRPKGGLPMAVYRRAR